MADFYSDGFLRPVEGLDMDGARAEKPGSSLSVYGQWAWAITQGLGGLGQVALGAWARMESPGTGVLWGCSSRRELEAAGGCALAALGEALGG